MPFNVEIADAAYDELQAIKAFYRNQIVDGIDEQFLHEPTIETNNRKILIGLQPDFEHEEPVWEPRVGEYRVYYDVSQDLLTVSVRAVRRKPPHRTTEQTA